MFFFPQTKYLDKRLMEKFLHQLLILLRTHCPDSRSEGLLKPQSNRFGVTLSKNRQHGGVRCQSSLAMIYCVQTCSSKVDCFNITGTMLIGSKGSKRRDLRVNCRLLSNGPDLPSRIKRLQCSRLDLRNNRIALDTQKKKKSQLKIIKLEIFVYTCAKDGAQLLQVRFWWTGGSV